EVGHHSYAHFSPIDQDEAAERADFERALAALERFGIEPEGFRCPSWEPAWRTPALVAEYGLAYDSSLMDSDRPYLLETSAGDVEFVEAREAASRARADGALERRRLEPVVVDGQIYPAY